MIIKWIQCEVEDNNRSAFTKAQKKWIELKEIEGFIGQIGGWKLNSPHIAGVLSFWQSQFYYERFMERFHDDLVEKNKQVNTYKNIVVNIYEEMGKIGSRGIASLLSEGRILRVTECPVTAEAAQFFEEEQISLGNKLMNGEACMLGELLGRHKQDGQRYLVASLWSSYYSHRSYTEEVLPGLVEPLNVKGMTDYVVGNVIEIQTQWTITHTEKGRMRK